MLSFYILLFSFFLIYYDNKKERKERKVEIWSEEVGGGVLKIKEEVEMEVVK